MAKRTFIHDIRAVSCVFGSVLIEEGLGEKAFSVERPEGFKEKKGADGSVTWSATNDSTAQWKIVLQAGSRHNAELEAMYQLDKAAPNGAGVRPFIVQDLNGTALFQYPFARIFKPAGAGYGTESDEREWLIYCNAENAQG